MPFMTSMKLALVLAAPLQVVARLGAPNVSTPSADGDEARVFTSPGFQVANSFAWMPSRAEFERGAAGRGITYWENLSLLSTAFADMSALPSTHGYQHVATTTRYGDTCCASCGKVDTAKLVEGTGYYAVAAAESMQGDGIGDGHFCTKDGSGAGGTGSMGCLSCAKGRFLPAHPMNYPLWAQPGDKIYDEEIHVVVADTCPNSGNEAWCPSHAGQKNKFGAKNHFDFANPPHKFDNYFFAWSKTQCSDKIKERYAKLSSC